MQLRQPKETLEAFNCGVRKIVLRSITPGLTGVGPGEACYPDPLTLRPHCYVPVCINAHGFGYPVLAVCLPNPKM